MPEHFHKAVTQENVLVGLTLIDQLFDFNTTGADVAHDASEAYPEDTTEMLGSMLAASLLVIQTYATASDIQPAEIIHIIREKVLAGDVDLPPMA